MTVKSTLKNILRAANIGVLRYDRLLELEKCKRLSDDLKFVLGIPGTSTYRVLSLLEASRSEYRQDLFVLQQLNFKRKGYFVEFGATNGVDGSNSHLLETQFGWNGILAEPATHWHDALRKNRSCKIETCCVWRESNQLLEFSEPEWPELSTLRPYQSRDLHANHRARGKTYRVQTVSLLDLLVKNSAPGVIDYLSIDTEGSEYDILEAFDFARYQFRVITCEHNFSKQRDAILALLHSHGYQRKYEAISGVDDWYVNPRLVEESPEQSDPVMN